MQKKGKFNVSCVGVAVVHLLITFLSCGVATGISIDISPSTPDLTSCALFDRWALFGFVVVLLNTG
eukprot:m.47854 g.47854  ORF g.47854 m.47854 type:complete len:66 (+) comp11311_c1_seq2:177-374(+)